MSDAVAAAASGAASKWGPSPHAAASRLPEWLATDCRVAVTEQGENTNLLLQLSEELNTVMEFIHESPMLTFSKMIVSSTSRCWLDTLYIKYSPHKSEFSRLEPRSFNAIFPDGYIKMLCSCTSAKSFNWTAASWNRTVPIFCPLVGQQGTQGHGLGLALLCTPWPPLGSSSPFLKPSWLEQLGRWDEDSDSR